jgi:hypothetical protein
LFCSGRKGLSVHFDTLARVSEGKDLRRLRELGFNRLVLLSESPVLAAVQKANPGSRYERQKYPTSISPTIDAWPVLFQDEDILIKDIPSNTVSDASRSASK